MPKKTQNEGRTKVNDLPKKEKKLNQEEKKKVKGGVMAEWTSTRKSQLPR